ncbi:MAG: hypothetical protein JWQ87_2224 [Candidatus Sulfotelmatobacter sp.]|nr:hypothetical protein [Candidatus Sulfotelmatobacter sp.]
MEFKENSGCVAQFADETTNYRNSLEVSFHEKAYRRAQAQAAFPRLGACMLCGAQATNRHSKSSHNLPVSVEDIVPVCDDCHSVIHYGDRRQGGASWAWRTAA